MYKVFCISNDTLVNSDSLQIFSFLTNGLKHVILYIHYSDKFRSILFQNVIQI